MPGSFAKGFANKLSEGIDESEKLKFQLAIMSRHIEMQQQAELQKQLVLEAVKHQNDMISGQQLDAGMRTVGATDDQLNDSQGMVGPQGVDKDFAQGVIGKVGANANSRLSASGKTLSDEQRSYYAPLLGKKPSELVGLTAHDVALSLPTVFMNPVTGDVIHAPPRTKSLPIPGAADAQRTINKISSFKNLVGTVDKLLDEIPDGRIEGKFVDLFNKYTGQFPEIAEARGYLDVMNPMIARVIGGDVGNLSETEQQRAESLKPRINDTTPERKRKVKGLLDLLSDVEARNKGVLSGPVGKKGLKDFAGPKNNDDQDVINDIMGASNGRK